MEGGEGRCIPEGLTQAGIESARDTPHSESVFGTHGLNFKKTYPLSLPYTWMSPSAATSAPECTLPITTSDRPSLAITWPGAKYKQASGITTRRTCLRADA